MDNFDSDVKLQLGYDTEYEESALNSEDSASNLINGLIELSEDADAINALLSIEDDPAEITLFSDSDEAAEIALFEESKSKFALAGYDTSSLDYEDLDMLNTREELIAIPDIEARSLSYYKEVMDSADNAIKVCNKSSIATVDKDIQTILSKANSIQMPDDCSSILQESVSYYCLNKKSNAENDGDIDVEDVIDYISTIPDLKKYLNTNTAINYITSLVKTINNFYNTIDSEDEKHDLLGSNISAFFLKEIRGVLAEINLALNDGRCSFAKQIKRDGNNAYFVCPKCGKILPIDSIAYVMIQAQKNSNDVNTFPGITKCSCNEVITLLSTEYEKIGKAYEKSVKRGISSFCKIAPEFSRGTAISINKPPASIVFDACSYLVSDLDEKDFETDSSSRIVTEATEPGNKDNYYLDNLEYRRALQEFYKKIHTNSKASYNPAGYEFTYAADSVNLDEDNAQMIAASQRTFSFRDVAQYMALSLSKDYKVLKNQAIFSFIDSLNSNCFFRDALNNKIIIECRNFLNYVSQDCPTNPKCINPSVATNLLNILNILKVENPYVGKLNDYDFLKSEEFITFLAKKIPECKSLLENLIETESEKRKRLIALIKKCKYELGFTKIKRIPTYKVDVINDYVWDNDLCEVIDEVSDRMIINYLSKDFFSIWQDFTSINKATLRNIYTSTQKEVVDKAVQSLIDKKLPAHEKSFIYNQFRPVVSFRMYEHSRLGKIVSYFKNRDFYNFCVSILELPKNIDSNMPLEFNDMFDKALEKLNSIAKQYVTDDQIGYLKFYLRDFTEDEIKSATDLSECSFNQFVPIRLENETIDDYLKRYNSLKASDALNIGNSYNFASYFDDILEECFVLYCSSLLSSFKFGSYLHGTFMYSLINSLLMYCDLSTIQDLLGISSSMLTLLERNSYIPNLFNAASDGYHKAFTIIYSSMISNCIIRAEEEYKSLMVFDSEDLNDLMKYDLISLVDGFVDSLPDDQKAEAEEEVELISECFKVE